MLILNVFLLLIILLIFPIIYFHRNFFKFIQIDYFLMIPYSEQSAVNLQLLILAQYLKLDCFLL